MLEASHSEAMSAAKMAPWALDALTGDLQRSPQLNELLCLPPNADPPFREIVARLLPGERQRIARCVRYGMQSANGFFRIDFRIRRFDDQVRWFLLRAKTCSDREGKLVTVTGMLIDLTERKLEEMENAYLASVVASTPYAVISVDRAKQIASWNEGATAAFGFTKAEALGRDVALIVPEGGQVEADGIIQRALSGQTLTRETERLRKDQSILPVKVTAAPIMGPDGAIVGVSAVYEDLTEVRAAEMRQALLVRELHHRVRNTLATVQGIAGVTAAVSNSIEEFRDAFTCRITALAQTHARLTEASKQTVLVSELIDQELGPFVSEAKVSANGPRIALSSDLAPTLAMIIHELATNATKHGALAETGGHIKVCWTVSDDNLKFTWSEHGVQMDRTPTRKGFGTKLLDIVAPAQFGSAVVRHFEPDGIRVSLSVPLDRP